MFADPLKARAFRKVSPDIALAKSLLSMSAVHLTFAASHTITEANASPLLVDYYEALREVCEAVCAKDGCKVSSHEAFTSYLKDVLREDLLALRFDRLRKLRNGVNYYGEAVSKEETEAAARDVPLFIETLKRKHLSGL